MTERLLLLDTPSLYCRAYFGVPESIQAPDGTPVNAVRGLLDMIARLLATRRPTHLVACDDADWRPAFRVAAIPSYKAHRVAGAENLASVSPAAGQPEIVPDTLAPQVPILWEVLAAVGLSSVGCEGHEADDVIGTLATRSRIPVDIVTGDRDLFQLVDDARGIRVFYTARGVGNAEPVTEEWVAQKYGIPGRAYADFALLRGDASDGLPGVKGIGDRKAAALISRFGSLEAIRAAATREDPALPPGDRAKLVAAADYLQVAPRVVNVVRDAPIPEADYRLPQTIADGDALVELSARWGLDSSLNRLLQALELTPSS